MVLNEGIIRILDSTTQSGPKMVEAISNYGDGRMRVGIMKLIDWGRECGKAQGLLQGRVEGAIVTGAAATVLYAVSSFFLLRQFRKEERRNQDAMLDILDDMAAIQADLKASPSVGEGKTEGSIIIEAVT